jgi:hypothetical protein
MYGTCWGLTNPNLVLFGGFRVEGYGKNVQVVEK